MCPLSKSSVKSLHGLRYIVLKLCTVGLHIQETEMVCVIECGGPFWSKMPGLIFLSQSTSGYSFGSNLIKSYKQFFVPKGKEYLIEGQTAKYKGFQYGRRTKV